MATKVVNCFRGTKLVGSFVVEQRWEARTSEQINSDAISTAKSMLAERKLAHPPFNDISFVVR